MTDPKQPADKVQKTQRTHEYTFWELDKVGEHVIFVIDGRDFEDDTAAYAHVRKALDQCDELKVSVSQFQVHKIGQRAPRSSRPTWEEYREDWIANKTERRA